MIISNVFIKIKVGVVFILFCAFHLQIAAQCDLDLYGLDISQNGRLSLDQLDARSGELNTVFDTTLTISSISAGSHILMNDIYYFVSSDNELYSINVKDGKFLGKQSFLSKSLRFMETSSCDSLIYGMGFQSIRGPAYLNEYDPSTGQLSQVTIPTALLDIPLDGNSIHTKLNDNYILIANGQLYNIDIHSGQITRQISTAGHNMISYVADPSTNLLYGLEVDPAGFALKSLDPSTGETKLIGATIKRLQLISKSAHAISDGHYYAMLDLKYYKLDLETGQIINVYDIHPDTYKFVEINNSCIPLIDDIKTVDTSCGQNNGVAEIISTDPSSSLIYNWISAQDNFTTTEKITRDLAPGKYTLITTTTDGSCKETTQTFIEESKELIYLLDQTDISCTGGSNGEINIIVDGQTADYQFSIDNGVNFQTEPDFAGLGQGLYHIVINGNGDCSVSDLVTIDSPDEFDISLEEGIEIPLGEEITLEPIITNTHPNIELSWTSNNPQYKISCTDCEETTVQPLSETTYYLHILDTNTGCSAVDSITYQVRRNKREVYIPNIFSPNGDGQNDEFGILGGDVTKVNFFSIYDRWGMRLMYVEDVEQDDPKAYWDGTSNGRELAPDTYSYITQVRYWDGLEKIIQGQITLVR